MEKEMGMQGEGPWGIDAPVTVNITRDASSCFAQLQRASHKFIRPGSVNDSGLGCD